MTRAATTVADSTNATTSTTVTGAAVEPIRSLGDRPEILTADTVNVVDGICTLGRHLIQCKAEHKGTFKAWVEGGALPFGYPQATRLMRIAERLDGLESTAHATFRRTRRLFIRSSLTSIVNRLKH